MYSHDHIIVCRIIIFIMFYIVHIILQVKCQMRIDFIIYSNKENLATNQPLRIKKKNNIYIHKMYN